VLDTFPGLQILMPHAGGSFPWLVGRWDNGIKRRPELAHVKQFASEYLRRFHYDTISHDAPMIRFLIDRIGADRFVLGTDYNMDAGVELPVDFLEEVPGITEEEMRLIARDNVTSLFDLSLPESASSPKVLA
jgi:aminocarboxymuconate-semialdehyde decarboxylase